MVSRQHQPGDASNDVIVPQSGPQVFTDSVAHATYQELARKYLDRKITRLFTQYTGMRIAITWAPPPLLPWRSVMSATTSGYCRLVRSKSPGRETCRKYAAGQLKVALRGTGKANRCTCPFGVRNVWAPIHIRGMTVGIICCQASCECLSARAESRIAALRLSPDLVDRSRSNLRSLSKADFDRAVQLLELIVDDVCQHTENDLERSELSRSTRAVAAHESLETRLRMELNHVLPFVQQNSTRLEKETHTQQVMRRALGYIHENFHRALVLQEVADRVGLSGSYLSTLFAGHMGIPFRRYLMELRLEKAQELLHDPGRRVADVAYAVGFTDPNTFRLAFKRMTGLSPSAWRETFQRES